MAHQYVPSACPISIFPSAWPISMAHQYYNFFLQKHIFSAFYSQYSVAEAWTNPSPRSIYLWNKLNLTSKLAKGGIFSLKLGDFGLYKLQTYFIISSWNKRAHQYGPSGWPINMAHQYGPSIWPISMAHQHVPSVFPHQYGLSVWPISMAHQHGPSIWPISIIISFYKSWFFRVFFCVLRPVFGCGSLNQP